MPTYHKYALFMFIYLGLPPRGISDAHTSAPMLELREHEYQAIASYTAKIYDDTKATLDDPGVRQQNKIPTHDRLMTNSERETYENLLRSLMIKKCQDKFPQFPEGAIIAAIFSIYECEEPHENLFQPQHPKPDIPDEQLQQAESFLKDNIQTYAQNTVQSDLYKQWASGLGKTPLERIKFITKEFRPHTDMKKNMATEILAANLTQGLAEHLSIQEDLAVEIFLYLQARDHWHPHEHIDTSDLVTKTHGGPDDRKTPNANASMAEAVEKTEQQRVKQKKNVLTKVAAFTGFAVIGGLILASSEPS